MDVTVIRDAATVYAEGLHRGLVMAAACIGKDNWSDVPPELKKLLREWQANLIHYEWRAEQGRPVDVPQFIPTEAEAFALSRAFACPHCKKGLVL